MSSDSESSGESDLEILPDEPSPIPPTRPSDPTAAAQYDTIKAVWYPRRRRPGIDSIKNALVAFKDVVKAVRDVWKEKTQVMKMAENKGENDKAAELKKDVVLQRGLMDVVIKTTLEMGHPSIVEKYVLFFFRYLTFLADGCHGHRSLKQQFERLSHVNLLACVHCTYGTPLQKNGL